MTPLPRWLIPGRLLRIGLTSIAALGSLLLATLIVHQLVLPILAIFVPELETTFYDLAVYGVPAREYHSTDLHSPDLSVLRWNDSCDDGGQIFLCAYGDWVEKSGPSILDDRGELIWISPDVRVATNFQMQEYKGEQYLTYWSGHKEGAKGRGAMYMLNSRYEVVRVLQAVGEGLYGDLHEFQITPEGTALITVYNDTMADMRDFGFFRGEHGWITDCLFQEIDVETNELLFQWVASEHVRPADTQYIQVGGGYKKSAPFDYYHINSIQKDSKGNYLISSRHFHAITYIEGGTGNIIWTLGHDHSDFEDISDIPRAATDFRWSHHARWIDEEAGIMSLFDNSNAGPLHLDRATSKGMIIQLDQEKRIVRLLQDFRASHNVRAHSQGDLQYLPSKDEVFMGWGGSGMWTQHSMDGTLLCEVHFAPAIQFILEKVKSYRAFKFWGWKGDPQWPPSAKVWQDKIYVSWNGATEVVSWRVEGRKEDEADVGHFETIATAEKVGFETAIELPHDGYSRFRVAALDAHGEVLNVSDPVEPDEPESPVPEVLGACAGVLFVGGVVYVLRFLLLRKASLRLTFPWKGRGEWSEYKYSQL